MGGSISPVGDILTAPNAEVVARDRSSAGLLVRRPELIAPSEWRAAIVTLVERNLGVKQAELAPAVGRWLGFAATSSAIRERVDEQAQDAQRRGQLKKDSDSWVKA